MYGTTVIGPLPVFKRENMSQNPICGYKCEWLKMWKLIRNIDFSSWSRLNPLFFSRVRILISRICEHFPLCDEGDFDIVIKVLELSKLFWILLFWIICVGLR